MRSLFQLSLFSNCLPLAVDCGILLAPQNGSVQGEVTTFPNELQFECDEGFTISGSSKRKCLANGTWNGSATRCRGKCIMEVVEQNIEVLFLSRKAMKSDYEDST